MQQPAEPVAAPAPLPLPRPQPSRAAIPNPAQRRRATTQRATIAEKAGAAARGAEASPARQWHAHQAKLEQAKAKKQQQLQQRQQPQQPAQPPSQHPPPSTSSPSSFAPSSVAAAASHALGLFSHLSSQLGELLLPKSPHPKLDGATIMQRHQEQLRAQLPPGHMRDLQRQQRREASREHAAAAAAALRHADATDSEEFSSGNQTEIEEEEEEEQKMEAPQIRSQTPPRSAALAWTPDAQPASSQQLSQSASSLPQAPCEFASFGCESLVHADRGMEDPHYTSAANHHISLLQLKFALIASQRNLLQLDVDAQNNALEVAHHHTVDLENRLRVATNNLQQALAKTKRQKAVLKEVQALRVQNVQDLVASYAGQPPVDAKVLLRSQRKQLEARDAELSAKDSLLLELAGLLKNTRLGPYILAKKHAAEHPKEASPKAATAASSAVAVAKRQKQKKQPQPQQQQQQQQSKIEQPLVVLPASNSPNSLFASMIAAAARRPPPPALALPAPVPAPIAKPKSQQSVSALAQRKLLEQSKPSSHLMRSLVASLTGDPSTQAADYAPRGSFGKENDSNSTAQTQQQQQKQPQQPQQRESATAAPRVFGPAAPTPEQRQQAAAASRSTRRKLRHSLLSSSAAEVEDDCPIPLMTEKELIALLPKDGSRVPRPIFMPDPSRPIVDNSQLPWEDYDGPYVHPHKQLRTMIESTEFLQYSAADTRLYTGPQAETEEDDVEEEEEEEVAAPFTLARKYRPSAALDDDDDEDDDDSPSPGPARSRSSIRELPGRVARSVGVHFLCPVVAKKKIAESFFKPQAEVNDGGSESED